MRVAARETSPQRALRDCSREARGKVKIQDAGEAGVQCNQMLIIHKVFY